MGYILLALTTLLAAAAVWRWPKARRDMLAGGLFALPFLTVQPLINGQWSQLSLGGVALLLQHIAWILVVGVLAGAVYTVFIHKHLTPVVHPRRGLMSWLAIGPLVAVAVLLVTKQSLLVSAGIGLGVELVLILAMQWVLVWDTLAAMVGMGLLYLALYLLFRQVLQVPYPDSGIILFGYPVEDLLRVLAFGALWGPPYAALRALNRGDTPFMRHHHTPKQVLSVSAITAFLVAFSWLNVQFIKVPQVIAASPADNQTIETLASPISIQMDRPFDRKTVAVTLSPSVDGNVSFEDSYLQRSFVRRIVFTPNAYFQPDTTYVVTVNALKNILGQQEQNYHYTFHTPALPTVASSVPTTDQKEVAICDPLQVVLSQPVTRLADITFALNPPVDLDAQLGSDQKTYTIKPKTCLAQNVAYTLTVLRRLQVYGPDGILLSSADPTQIYSSTFATKAPPGITDVIPQGGGVLTTAKDVTISFSEAMQPVDLASSLSLKPEVAGSWAWRDTKTAVYTFASALPFDTQFALSLPEGLHDQRGGFVPADATFTFTTIGHVRVSAISPYRGSVGVSAGATISVTFDQSVDQTSAEQRFSLSPAANGSFTWKDRVMSYHADLAKDTGYQVTEAAGVHSLVGIDMESAFSSSFQTEESTTLLGVGVYYQQHALSCEVASLKMGLSYRGVNVSEDTLLGQLPTDSSSRNGNIWADPDQVFVGDVNGHQNSTGYGVYAGPLASLAKQYRSAQVVSGWSVQQLAQSIADGNPVVIWGTAGSAKQDSWQTSEGKQINAWVGEHARLLVGFTGKADNPTHFIINDPIFGRLKWTTAQLKANWGVFGNMGVAIQ